MGGSFFAWPVVVLLSLRYLLAGVAKVGASSRGGYYSDNLRMSHSHRNPPDRRPPHARCDVKSAMNVTLGSYVVHQAIAPVDSREMSLQLLELRVQ